MVKRTLGVPAGFLALEMFYLGQWCFKGKAKLREKGGVVCISPSPNVGFRGTTEEG